MNICGHDYTIEFVDGFKGEEKHLLGRVFHDKQKIEILEEMPVSQTLETFLHEVGHCILWHYGHNSEEITVEDAIDVFSCGMYNMGVGKFLFDLAMIPKGKGKA